ncbi:hypothetical protein GCM10011504_58430 [Siccirubricoccus deserti]|nr:hypothetical protein GCM10011504_58430 [Siccirubricoccus deserti]
MSPEPNAIPARVTVTRNRAGGRQTKSQEKSIALQLRYQGANPVRHLLPVVDVSVLGRHQEMLDPDGCVVVN